MKTDVPEDRFRSDIQGLRAVAVVAVVLAHVLGWPRGGFVGVDVFFVISGFLITGVLIRDHETHGRLSLRRFWATRLRRIAPAAVLVLAATTMAAWFLFNQPRFVQTAWDAASSFLLVSNWRFAAEGTDYFAMDDAVSPLQHFWSLSVEEQFYIIWPVLLLVVLLLFRKRGRAAAGLLLTVLVAASFAFALWQSAADAPVAYFSTLTRVWELGLGALLATAAPLLARLPLALRAVLGWAGLAGILVSFFVIDDTVLFPAPWAALPVLATAAVLVSGLGRTPKHLLFPLTNPVSRFFGDISYSLYLWHFPVLVFLAVLMPVRSLQGDLLILGLGLALALVSYFLVEQPLHRSPWLRARGEAAAEAWQSWRERFGAQFILSSLGLVVIVVAVAVTVQLSARGSGPLALPQPDAPAAGEQAPGAAPGDPAADPATVNPEDALQIELWNAASATEWPGDLSPSMDQAIADGSSRNPAAGCFAVGGSPDFDRCSWGDGNAPNRLYLVGDSTALAYAPAFKEIAESSGGQWRVTTVGLYGCRFTDVLVQNDGAGVMDACPARKQEIAERIAAEQPQLVVVSNAYALGNTTDRRPLSTGDLVASTLAESAQYGVPGRVVHLAPPPLGGNLGACYSPVTSPQDCTTGIDPAWSDFQASFEAAVAASGTGDHVVSSLGFSCAEGYCPAFAGTTPTKYDQVHMTPEYAKKVAPSIRWELAAQGLL
ncbi:acyltransferase [Herbiconiux sp. CPCC 203407]|uniref:Acyltransferase n=1 Tax=Herbiconiux oxytropis TaxID=2970915 RepID=A0AA41XHC0_9MICO|nr:acyltransferase family protein [Herbiconiux oxytropis]MCS5721291.1 acyltransferase [Herbiconiux oxytropis]MCS5726270.1 acyltransferase [Herbiconiux oxytropis]